MWKIPLQTLSQILIGRASDGGAAFQIKRKIQSCGSFLRVIILDTLVSVKLSEKVTYKIKSFFA